MKLRSHSTSVGETPTHRWPSCRRGGSAQVRPGITLLEVVLAMTIFLFSLTAIYQLASFGNARALDTRDYSKASLLCQSKLAELVIGAEALETTQAAAFAGDDAAYQYEIDVTEGAVTGLKNVRVTVKLEKDGRSFEVSLQQVVLDPTVRGSTLDKLNASPGTMTGGMSP